MSATNRHDADLTPCASSLTPAQQAQARGADDLVREWLREADCLAPQLGLLRRDRALGAPKGRMLRVAAAAVARDALGSALGALALLMDEGRNVQGWEWWLLCDIGALRDRADGTIGASFDEALEWVSRIEDEKAINTLARFRRKLDAIETIANA